MKEELMNKIIQGMLLLFDNLQMEHLIRSTELGIVRV